MNIRKSTVYVSILLLAGLWYFVRLARLTNVDPFVIVSNYIFLACVILTGQLRFKRLVNPISLLTPLLLAFTYYGVMMSDRQDPLGGVVVFSYYSFVVAFVVGCMVPQRFTPMDNHASPAYNMRIANLLLMMASVVFVAEAAMSGGFPLLTLLIHQVDSYADMKLIPVLHYLVMFTALLPALYYSLYKSGEISRLRFIVFSLLSAFILLNSLSRQLMIFGVIAFYFSYVKLNNVNEARLVSITGVLAAVLFLGVGEFRIGAIDSSVSSLDYLKAYSDVPLTLPVNTFEVTYNLYTSLNFNTFQKIVRETDSFYFGAYTVRPLLDISQINNVLGTGIPDSRDTFKMLGTIIADPYLDFGILGVIVFGFLYGVFGTCAFLAYMARDAVAHALMWSVFAYVMVMAVFTNFFNVFFIWLCIGLSWVLLIQPGRRESYVAIR